MDHTILQYWGFIHMVRINCRKKTLLFKKNALQSQFFNRCERKISQEFQLKKKKNNSSNNNITI